MNKKIFVYIDVKELQKPILMGRLEANAFNGRETFMFEYSKNWLLEGLYKYYKYIDPDLSLHTGAQFLVGKINFGAFMDAAPDSWGAAIMQRREDILSIQEGRRIKDLYPSDYLLGVDDETRSGALRFKLDENGEFLSNNKGLSVPPFASLQQLEKACLKVEEDNTSDPEYSKWIEMLIDPASSLGGARPKASVIDEQGNLWIAKFPSLNDKIDVGAWEMVTNDLARLAGINVAEGAIRKFNSKYHTFLSKRFDRENKNTRIHFASAKTLLGRSGNDYVASYLDIVKVIIKHGTRTNKDLEELWRRIVFSICVRNTDDHLRNHGFLLTKTGWVLSPAYDVNPYMFGRGLYINISKTSNALDLGLALSVATQFRLKEDKAIEIINKVQSAVGEWRTFANRYVIPQVEQERMAQVFLTKQK